jgi:hypothetical protein
MRADIRDCASAIPTLHTRRSLSRATARNRCTKSRAEHTAAPRDGRRLTAPAPPVIVRQCATDGDAPPPHPPAGPPPNQAPMVCRRQPRGPSRATLALSAQRLPQPVWSRPRATIYAPPDPVCNSLSIVPQTDSLRAAAPGLSQRPRHSGIAHKYLKNTRLHHISM